VGKILVDVLGLQDGLAFRRSDPSRDSWFLYRLSISYLTTINKWFIDIQSIKRR